MLRIRLAGMNQQAVFFVADLGEGMRCIDQSGLYFKMHPSFADDRCSNQPGAATDAGCSLYPFRINRVNSGLADVVSLNVRKGATGKNVPSIWTGASFDS